MRGVSEFDEGELVKKADTAEKTMAALGEIGHEADRGHDCWAAEPADLDLYGVEVDGSSLAGDDTLYDALFERYGVARMKSVSAFAETLKFLHNGGPIRDSRLVSLSCSGGEAALVADMALEKRVSFPPFSAETKPRVAATLNEYVAIDNPLDYHTFI